MTYTYTAAPFSPRTQFEQFREYVVGAWGERALDDCLAHRAELGTRIDVLGRYTNRSQPQDAEFEDVTGATVIMDELISETVQAKRSADIEHLRQVAADPANLERPAGVDGEKPAAPALVTNPGTRIESPQETLQRMRSDPWRGPDGDRLAGHTSYDRRARARPGSWPARTPRWRASRSG
jgi:hypothetical protein